MHWLKNSIGELFKVVAAHAPADRAAGAANSASIDRLGCYSGKLVVQTGAASGGPATQTVDAKIQHSADAAVWSDYTDRAGDTVAIEQITAEDTLATVDVDLAAAERYVRVVMTTAFTGGAAPTILSAASLCVGGPDEAPVE